MRNIFRIYRRDMKNLVTNYVAFTIILGLAILPSLYAWFNIRAYWDPYSSTKGIQVAIVNEDKGSDVEGNKINIGNDVVEELSHNDKIGWKFVTKEDAEYGVIHGRYYASIIIPSTFSENLTSLLKKNPKKPQLIYNVNEKNNAVAPKITDKGASTIQENITTQFVKMVNGVIFESFNKIGVDIKESKPDLKKLVDFVGTVNDNMDTIKKDTNDFYEGSIALEDFIKKIQNNVPALEDALNNAISAADKGKELINDSKETIETVTPFIKDNLIYARDTSKELNTILNSDLKNIDTETAIKILGKADTLLNDIKSKVVKIADTVDRINQRINNDKIKDFSEGLRLIVTNIENQQKLIVNLQRALKDGEVIANDTLDQLRKDTNKMVDFFNEKIDKFDTDIKPSLDDITNKLLSATNDALKVLNDTKGTIPELNNLLDLANRGADIGKDALKEFKDKLPDIEKSVKKVNDKIGILSDDEKLDKIIDLLETNPDVAKDFIASPVDLVENKIYPIPNYGTGMAPFFTVLALWIGALLLASLLTVDAEEFEDDLRPLEYHEKYLGKFLTFVTIAIVQALIVTLGDKYLLGVYIVDVKGFVTFAVFTSIVFTMIVYTLASLFGAVGKAVGVVFLVLQIAGAGGTFPIQVTPKFFQTIYPGLPFTYAIGAMREFVGGPIKIHVIHDAFVLLAFFFGFLFLGLVLKGPVSGLNDKVSKKFKESGLSE